MANDGRTKQIHTYLKNTLIYVRKITHKMELDKNKQLMDRVGGLETTWRRMVEKELRESEYEVWGQTCMIEIGGK